MQKDVELDTLLKGNVVSAEEHDEELRWRLEVLKTKLDEGRFQFAQHLVDDLKRSLSAVRYGPDGKVDLKTVDGRVRSLALMAAVIQNREEEKAAISLQDISNNYFEVIEKNLGHFAVQAKELGYNANQIAHVVSETPDAVDQLAPQLPNFVEALGEFWSAVATPSDYHIQDINGSKAIFGGDLFPSYERNIASTAGLYIDTIVLSDPFYNSRHIFREGSQKQQVYYLIKHAINVLGYKELATADVGNPIVVFTPFQSSVDDHEAELLRRGTEADGLKHAQALYGREFESLDDFRKFSSTLDTPSRVVEELSDPDRLLFDTEWQGTLEEKIQRSLDGDWSQMTGDSHPGQMVVDTCFGRMGQATDLLLKSRYLMGTPLIDAPTSWNYFNWKLEYNSALAPDKLTHLHMVKGLQHVAETDEQWLGDIPPEALIEMRREGAFEEIRDALASGVEEIANVNPAGFFRSSDKIVDNIRDAFDVHSRQVGALMKRQIKFAGHDIGSMIVAGGIDIASIAIGTPTFGAASFAVNQLIDVPKLREIPERFRTLKNAHNELRKSPMGMLFRHK